MKNKDMYETYDAAYDAYYNGVIQEFGATRLPWGFGRWLWMEHSGDRIADWQKMRLYGILTNEGVRRLKQAEQVRA